MLVICVCLLASSVPWSAKAQGTWAKPQNTFKSGNTGFSGWNSADSNNAFSTNQNSGLGSWNLNAATNVQPVSTFDESYSNWGSDSYNGNSNNKPGFASSGSWGSNNNGGMSSFGDNSRREYETSLGKNTGRNVNKATTSKTPKKQKQNIGNAGNWQSDAFSANNEKKSASIMNPPTSSKWESNSNQFSLNSNKGNSGFSNSADWDSNFLNNNNPVNNEVSSTNDEENSINSWSSNINKNPKPSSGLGGWGSSGQSTKESNSNNNSKSNNRKPSNNNNPKNQEVNNWNSNLSSDNRPESSQSGSSPARDTSVLDELDKNDWYFGKESNYPRPPFRSALNIDVSELWKPDRSRKPNQNFGSTSGSIGNTNNNNSNNNNKRRRNRETGIRCECVDVSLCDEEDMVISKEDLKNDWRPLEEFQCQRLNEVCCTKPKTTQLNEIEEDYELEPLGCGQRRLKETFHNIGENVAQPGEFPWNLKIENFESDANCSASLIHSKLVLTAAHCVDSSQAGSLNVRAGLWNTDNEPSQSRRVTKVILHPDYSSANPRNDIALLVLDKPFKLTENVNTVCLPLANEKWATNGCFVAGWRPKEINGKVFEVLEKGIVGFLPQSECQAIMLITDLWRDYVLHESFVCGIEKNGRNACLGDEGSPLICPSAESPNLYFQVGIVSNSMNCDNFGRPGIFTNVLKFLDWINKNTFDLGLFDDIDFRILL